MKCVIVSISYDDNHYTTGTSWDQELWLLYYYILQKKIFQFKKVRCLFLVELCTVKTNIINYYLSPNSATLKFCNNLFRNKTIIFFYIKNTWLLSFLDELCIAKTNVINYYLLPNSTALKFCIQQSDCLNMNKKNLFEHLYFWLQRWGNVIIIRSYLYLHFGYIFTTDRPFV